ncbi:polysaccharide deacetylase family protein [Candidatus Ruminimicrobium bovinum]|uniref:polysaccharide deacetylase family protein n=1 Tax=Candidatus Ruminimicrobium bovinum TaxID=3242779 RepID=UPI0039B96533
MKNLFIAFILTFFTVSFSYTDDNIFYTHGNSHEKKIALTFDDGPSNNTDYILNILKEKNVKATFFILAVNVIDREKTLKKIYEHGHEIASHTYNHINFHRIKEMDKLYEEIFSELKLAEIAIKDVLGFYPVLVRYPHGYTGQTAFKIAKENGYKVINWTFGCDWHAEIGKEQMYQMYKANVQNGYILLMHDSQDISKLKYFLPKVIDYAKENGFEIVTVSELLNLKKETTN